MGLAAHNCRNFWRDLHTLSYGDIIIYNSTLGTKTYAIYSMTIICQSDWSLLENTDTNMLTLITCVRRTKRIAISSSSCRNNFIA